VEVEVLAGQLLLAEEEVEEVSGRELAEEAGAEE
jgi:hypothetical protein